MFTIDTDSFDVQTIHLTVDQIRSNTHLDTLVTALDLAQGDIFSGEARKRYVVIEVTE